MCHRNISKVRTNGAWLRCKPRTPGRLCSHKHCTTLQLFACTMAALQTDSPLPSRLVDKTALGQGLLPVGATPHSHTSPTLLPSIDTVLTGLTVHRNLPLDCNPLPLGYNHPGIRMRAWESFSCVKSLENRRCVPLFSMKCRGKE